MDLDDFSTYDITALLPPVDWESRGDAFVEYLRNDMPYHFSANGWRTPGVLAVNDPFHINGWRLQASELDVQILLIFTDSTVAIFAASPQELHHIEDLNPWLDALRIAAARIAEEDPAWKWSCLIGTGSDFGNPQRLKSRATISHNVVDSATTPHSDSVENRLYPGLTGGSTRTEFPVRLKGATAGYSWEIAASKAVEEASKVCAVLSLAFSQYWRIREPPQPGHSAYGAIPEWRWPDEQAKLRHHLLGGVEDVATPGWASAAREMLEADPVFSRSLLAHHQGLLLADQSPSLALICFTGAIEGIGSEHAPNEKFRKQFRVGLLTAMTEEEASALSKIYSLRSSTAHSGALHGNEATGGALLDVIPRMFSANPKHTDFRYQTLIQLQRACAKVLITRVIRASSPTE